MRRAFILAAACAALLVHGAPARAGVYTDDLSKCLVASATKADQDALMEWMFGMIALNPAVRPYAALTPRQHEAYDRQMAALMQRLMTVDCRKQTVAAMKYEGSGSIEAGFKVLGEVAMRGLMADPAVSGGAQAFLAYIDQAKFAELGAEAGISATTSTAPTKNNAN